MDNEEYRKKVELEILQIIEESLKVHQIDVNRAREIARYILSSLHPQMTLSQIHAVVQQFEDHFPELIPVVVKASQDYKRNEQLMQAWEQSKEARIDRLLRGDDMNNLEERAYLTQVLGSEPLPTTDAKETKKREALIAQFDIQRHDIGRALLYQNGDAQPVRQRHLLINEAHLRFVGISTEQAQENFARGWDETKKKGNIPPPTGTGN